jgi:sulfur carrier protein
MTITVNGTVCELQESATIADLLQQLRLDPLQVAVEVNRQLVPRQRHGEHPLSAGDTLEIVTLVGGG